MAVEQPTKGKKTPTAPVQAGKPSVLVRGRGFFHEVWVELQKTTWPTPREAWRLTTVVLTVIVIVALYIGAIDFLLTFVTRKFSLFK